MNYNQRFILSTRPLHTSLIDIAAEKNIIVETDSFISTIPVRSEETDEKIKQLSKEDIVVVFTSMNAVESVTAILATEQPCWKIFSIGNTTKKLIQQYFKKAVIQGNAGNASHLADEIIREGNTTPVTFFCGDHRRDALPEKLKEKNIEVREIIVYKTVQHAHHLRKSYDGIMFFSPSAVESFFRANTVGDNTVLFAIGETTATCIEQYSANKVIIGDRPGKEELLNKVIAHFNNINQQHK